jgi:hypothetical protein
MLPNFPDKIKSKKKKFERVKMNLIFFFKIWIAFKFCQSILSAFSLDEN